MKNSFSLKGTLSATRVAAHYSQKLRYCLILFSVIYSIKFEEGAQVADELQDY
jgi:hypothetical protein